MTIYDVHRNSEGAAFKEGAYVEAPGGSTEDQSAADRCFLERQHSRRNSTVGEWDSWKPARDLA